MNHSEYQDLYDLLQEKICMARSSLEGWKSLQQRLMWRYKIDSEMGIHMLKEEYIDD